MQFTISFLEYLVNGCIAVTWLVVMTDGSLSAGISQVPAVALPVVVAAIYVLGMLIEYTSYVILLLRKMWHTIVAKEEVGVSDQDVEDASKTAAIFLASPDLGNQLQIRATRDRIMRGTLLNLTILEIALIWKGIPSFLGVDVSRHLAILIVGVLIVAAASAWDNFEVRTKRFRHGAYDVVIKTRRRNVSK